MKLWWKPLLWGADYLELQTVDPNDTVASLISNRLWHQHDAAAQATVKLYRVSVAGAEPTAEEEALAQQGSPLPRRKTVLEAGLADGDSLILIVPQAYLSTGVARLPTLLQSSKLCVCVSGCLALHLATFFVLLFLSCVNCFA